MGAWSQIERFFSWLSSVFETIADITSAPIDFAMNILLKLMQFAMDMITSTLDTTIAIYEKVFSAGQFQLLQAFALAVVIIMSGIRLYNHGILEDRQDIGFSFFLDTFKNILFILFGTKAFALILSLISDTVRAVTEIFISDASTTIGGSVSEMSETFSGVELNTILLIIFLIIFSWVIFSTLYSFMKEIAKHSVVFILLGFFAPLLGAVSVFNIEYMERVKAYTVKKASQLLIGLVSINVYVFLLGKIVSIYGEVIADKEIFVSGTSQIALLVFLIVFSVSYDSAVSELAEAIFGTSTQSHAGKSVNATKAIGRSAIGLKDYIQSK